MPDLVWDGKYGADGPKTRPVRVALPFPNVETVNEFAQERSLMLDLFARNEAERWLVETKGAETVEVAHKVRAGMLWCETPTCSPAPPDGT